MIKTIMVGGTFGTVGVFDEHGEQVPEWQTHAVLDHLRKMLDAGVIDGDTPVETVRESYRLEPDQERGARRVRDLLPTARSG